MNRHDPSTTTLDDRPATTAGVDSSGEQGPLAEARGQVGETAGHLAERAAGMGLQQADHGRERAAQGISQVADSIRRVSLDMETDQPAVASAGMTAADQAERLARYLQRTDAREILHTVEDAARRQPLLFLGGAFVLGVAASRFLKAGSGSGSSAAGDRFGGYGNAYRSGASADFRTAGYDAGRSAAGSDPWTGTRDGAVSEGL